MAGLGTIIVEAPKKGVEIGVKEFVMKNAEKTVESAGDFVKGKMSDIKNHTLEQLKGRMEDDINPKTVFEDVSEAAENREAKEGLTDKEKAKIKGETGWSDEIVEAFGSGEECEIYKKAGLTEAEINGKGCLIRNDIDWEQKDCMGRTNKERAEQGLSPVNRDGRVIELHHIGQHADSPLAELTPEEHRGKGSDGILHNKTKESEIDRQAFAQERNSHWEARANEGSK